MGSLPPTGRGDLSECISGGQCCAVTSEIQQMAEGDARGTQQGMVTNRVPKPTANCRKTARARVPVMLQIQVKR